MGMRCFRLAGAAVVYLLLAGCTPPPAPVVAPPRPAPDNATVLRIKEAAYDAGLEAGKRLQARRDAAELAAARAALSNPPQPGQLAAGPQAPAKTDCPTPATIPPAPLPNTTPAPVYVPAGPAVPVSRAD